jgi:hypothetical protein
VVAALTPRPGGQLGRQVVQCRADSVDEFEPGVVAHEGVAEVAHGLSGTGARVALSIRCVGLGEVDERVDVRRVRVGHEVTG